MIPIIHTHTHNPPLHLQVFRMRVGESLEGRTLGGSASAAGISSHGDGLLVLLDVLEESNSALKLPAVDGLGGLASVLEGHSEVGTAGAGRLRGLNLGGSVSNLCAKKKEEASQPRYVSKIPHHEKKNKGLFCWHTAQKVKKKTPFQAREHRRRQEATIRAQKREREIPSSFLIHRDRQGEGGSAFGTHHLGDLGGE